MYDKKKCKSCKYHSHICTFGVHCNYSLTGNTCIKRDKNNNKITDIRGNDPNKCLLYERGK